MEVIKFRRKRRRLKKGALAIILGFLAAAVLTILLIMYFGGSEGTVQTGAITAAHNYDAVVIRKEKIVSSDEFSIADYFADEGQRVEPGDAVMNVYKMGYSSEITLSLRRTQQEIYEAQLEVLGEARDVELRSFDDGIDSAKARLSNAVLTGDTASVLRIQNELTDLLSARSEYLRGYIQETETLRSLYKKESDWQRAVEDSRTELTAPTAGVVSYYFDDFSVALNADKLSTVTSDLITSALKRGKSAKLTGAARQNAYRIVDTGEWYCVFLTEISDPLRVAEGQSYPVEIAGYGDYEGVAVNSFVSGKKVVNVIKVESDVGELISARVIKARVTFAATDLKVDRRAIQFENGDPFIEVVTEEGRVGVYVNVLSDDGDHVIVNAKNTDNAPLHEGTKYWIPKRRISRS